MSTRIHADAAKNTLYLILDGFFGEGEIKNAVAMTYTEVKKLRAGFSVINDLTGFRPTDPKAGDSIKAAQTDLVKLGMKRVVRVVGQNVLGELQFSLRGKQVGYEGNLKVETAGSVADAEKLLSAAGG